MAERQMHRMTETEAAELRQILGARPDVLIQARGPQSMVLVLRDRLAVRQPTGWQLIAWTDIQRGGWDSERQELSWELVDGTEGSTQLDAPGQLPHAFAERVRASIAVARQIRLDDDMGTVMLVGRRSPGSDEPISWQVEGLGRCDLSDPQVQAQVVELVDELRAEFE